jgi:hypothetical protein
MPPELAKVVQRVLRLVRMIQGGSQRCLIERQVELIQKALLEFVEFYKYGKIKDD